MFNISEDLETKSSVSSKSWWHQPLFSNSPNVAVPVCWFYPPSKSITLACLSLLKVFMRIVERFHFISTVEGKSSTKIMTAGALGFSLPFNEVRLLVLICFHVLKPLLCSNWHPWEGDCSVGISSLGPATCLARKCAQVGFTSFKCHYSKGLLNLCTLKWERHHTEWKDGWQAWMNALVRFSILDCHAFPGPDANI